MTQPILGCLEISSANDNSPKLFNPASGRVFIFFLWTRAESSQILYQNITLAVSSIYSSLNPPELGLHSLHCSLHYYSSVFLLGWLSKPCPTSKNSSMFLQTNSVVSPVTTPCLVPTSVLVTVLFLQRHTSSKTTPANPSQTVLILGTKHSDTRAHGGHSHSNHHRGLLTAMSTGNSISPNPKSQKEQVIIYGDYWHTKHTLMPRFPECHEHLLHTSKSMLASQPFFLFPYFKHFSLCLPSYSFYF